MAVNFCTMAFLRARNAAPTAIVVVVTQGKPTGTPMICSRLVVNDSLVNREATHQKNQSVNKQVVIFWSCEIDTTEKAADPDSQQPNNDAWEYIYARIMVSQGQIKAQTHSTSNVTPMVDMTRWK